MATIEDRLTALETKIAAMEARPASPVKVSVTVADDSDLDGQWGDPTIKYGLKEKYWPTQPDTHIDKRFSECGPAYLGAMAKYLRACAYIARRDGDETKASYKERDAARAEGWRRRNEAKKAPSSQRSLEEDDGSILF